MVISVPNYVALDPGGTTGVCIFDSVTGEITTYQLGPHTHHLDLWALLATWDPDVVICEGFEYRNTARPGLVLVSKEYIGMAKLWCLLNNKKYVEQTAAMAKGFIPDKGPRANVVLKKLGLYSTAMKHANDATRHMVYWLVNGKHELKAERDWILNKGFKP